MNAFDPHATHVTVATDELLIEAVKQYQTALDQGDSPDREALLLRYPEIAADLADCLDKLHFLRSIAPQLNAGAATDARQTGAAPATTSQLGDFRILREIGRGGMGVVYEAEQISLNRRVALKVLPFAAVLDPRQLMRFKHEAQAAAMLKHPNIVSVHAVGCDRAVHFYAMELVEGESLAQIVEQLRAGSKEQGARSKTPELHAPSSSLPADTVPVASLPTLHAPSSSLPAYSSREHFRHIAQFGIQAAEALHYAHEMGIVHRDIKPSNLLVNSQGHLWVTDFGLATTQTDTGLTMTGELLGTLRYMSPEQAAGDRAKTDYRTDIYSLGITLFELLTGQPAFADTDRKLLLRRILEDNPQPPRSIDPAIPRDLETIVLKATEKDPQARYDSAAELAADLQRFCDEKPIRARRTSRAERAWRWSKRNRVIAALSITVATLITLVAVTAPLIAWRQARLIDKTQQQLYAKDVSIAYNAWNEGDLGHVREILDRYAAGSRYAHLRDFPWYYLNGLYQRATAGFMPGGPFDVSLSTNLLAVASEDTSDDLIHLYDIGSWRAVGTLAKDHRAIHCLRFSPDGRFLAAGCDGGTLSAWDIGARKQLYTINADNHAVNVHAVAFSPDGTILASGGPDRDVKIWDTTTGKSLRTLSGHSDDASALAFSPDGKTLATSSFDYSLRFWDTETWLSRVVVPDAFSARVLGLAYDPTGARLASTGYSNEVILWDAAGRKLGLLPTSGSMSSLSFSPDGQFLAAGGDMQGTVEVWDIEQQKLVGQYRVGHAPATVGFLPNGELLLASDGKLMRRHLSSPSEAAAEHKKETQTEEISIAVSPAGDLLVAGFGRYEADPGNGGIACWDLRRGTRRPLPGHDGSSINDVAIDRAGELIVASGGPRYGPGFVRLWNARTAMLTELPKEKHVVGGVAISPDGDRLALATVGPGGRVSVWTDLTSQPELLWSRDAIRAMRVAFSPNGEVLAIGCFGSDFARTEPATVMFWDAETGETLDDASSDRSIMEIAFSPDGRLLASIDWDGKLEVYDRKQRTVVLSELAHQRAGFSVAFSPDGRTLASGSSSGQIKLWHVPTMMHVTTFNSPARVAELEFFPDGQTLAVGYTDRTVELWHVNSDRELFRIDETEE
jgi:WD40 repeat protein/serine/threonine protein kinase